MPFVADIDTRDESRGPIWGPFAVIRDNVEHLVALNLGWSAQLVPGIVALASPGLPFWLRVVLVLSSATLLIATAGPFYALALAATRGEHLSLELAIHHLREFTLPGLKTLTPLYGIFGLLIWLAVLAGPVVPVVMTLATLAGLLWYLCATYWGPLLVSYPDASTTFLAERSIRFVWRHPAETLATALVAALALLVGLVSIGGLVLIVPVAVAMLHTQRYLSLPERGDTASRRGRAA